MNHCDAQWIPAFAGMTGENQSPRGRQSWIPAYGGMTGEVSAGMTVGRSAVAIFPDAFLRFSDYEILENPGQVSAKVAKALAEKEYAAFRVAQDRAFESDFDRLVEKSGERVKKGRES